MKKTARHIDSLERSRGLLMQISIIASLLIMLIVFESTSSYSKEDIVGFTEINIEIEKFNTKHGNIKPPTPNQMGIGQTITNNRIKLNENGFENIIFNIDKQAEFIGGEEALRTYLTQQKQYSAEAKRKNIQGRVNISFIVDENGTVTNAKVVRSIHPLIDTEALRLISAMPDWMPAEAKGKAIKSKQIIPVMFINN